MTALSLLAFGSGALRAEPKIDDPIHHYSFDEASGTVAQDTGSAASADTNGTLVGATPGVPGALGTAFEFDGVSAYVNLNDASVPTSGSYSIFLFVQTASVWHRSSQAQIVGNNKNQPHRAALAITGSSTPPGNDAVPFWFHNGAEPALLSSGVNISDGQWHSVGVSYDAGTSTATFYVDGKAVSAANDIAPLTDETWYVGAARTLLNSQFFRGAIDDVRIYDRALTAEDAAALADLINQQAQAPRAPAHVPGTEVFHSPASTGAFVGSPGIVILPNGDYLAKCDLFGPGPSKTKSAVTKVFRSHDKGQTWEHVTDVQGLFWASLFTHGEDVYMMGTNKTCGDAVIFRSKDDGETWTSPVDSSSGLLLSGKYQCGPVPVVEYKGRLWRGMGTADWKTFVMSAPAGADLLQAENWTCSEAIPGDKGWLNNQFNIWLEENVVVKPDGSLAEVLRVSEPRGGIAALASLSPDGKTLSFSPSSDFIEFPGGSSKFTIRYDPVSKRYWSLANYIPSEQNRNGIHPERIRNTLALVSSADLKNWEVKTIVLRHPDLKRHAFQYLDWQFDGDDLVAVSRTAFDDEFGGAADWHNANFLTFHRVKNFRRLTMNDSAAMPE